MPLCGNDAKPAVCEEEKKIPHISDKWGKEITVMVFFSFYFDYETMWKNQNKIPTKNILIKLEYDKAYKINKRAIIIHTMSESLSFIRIQKE